MTYLPPGLPAPLDDEGVAAPYWQGLHDGVLRVQRCERCDTWQFGGEWLCHRCLAFDPPWLEVAAAGRIFSWERVWHPVHPALKERGPYLVVLVELPHAGGVRMLGNLLGNALQEVRIGDAVRGLFERQSRVMMNGANVEYGLLQWTV